MIVRDAEETLGVTLQSVAGVFEQTVVVDTGSTDSTIEIARSFGAEVHHFTWIDDFAAARNFSFEQLKTPWAFWLDADDLLVGREYFEDLFTKVEDRALDGAVLEYFYAFHPPGEEWVKSMEPDLLQRPIVPETLYPELRKRCITTQWRERLVKRIPSWRWLYPVHEALPAVGHPLGRYDQIKIIHRRYARAHPVATDRNLKILQKYPPETRDERIWFKLGLECAHHATVDDAIHAFEKYLTMGTLEEERYLAHCFLGDLYRTKGETAHAATRFLQAADLRPAWRDAYAGLLRLAAEAQQWEKAIHYGQLVMQTVIPDTPFAYNPVNGEVGWVSNLVQALAAVGRLEEALTVTQQAKVLAPHEPAFTENIDALSTAINLKRGQETFRNLVEFYARYDNTETAAFLLGRNPELGQHPEAKPLTAAIDQLCGNAAAGVILPVPYKRNPERGSMHPKPEDQPWEWPWPHDVRAATISAFLAAHPEIQRVLQIGGPHQTGVMWKQLGKQVSVCYHVPSVGTITDRFDLTILWNALEGVARPSDLVQMARQATAPDGWLMGIVANGAQTRGLGVPETLKLRAYGTDTFRRVMGTVRMPTVTPGWSAEAGDMILTVPMLGDRRARSFRTIAIVCPSAPEPWGPNSLTTGIGGSEEAVIRLARAFTRRGHRVVVYGSGWAGEDWAVSEGPIFYKPMSAYHPHDILIAWRHPEVYTGIRQYEAEWKALWLHDSAARERVEPIAPFIDCIWTISAYHASLYAGIPHVYVGRNGIDPDEFRTDPTIVRNPYKCVYVSTPFRGLDVLLERHWPEIVRRQPKAELHCYYGWHSADRMGHTTNPEGAAFKQKVMNLVADRGAIWHGRVGQPELYHEMAGAGVWTYPTTWNEEHCISAYIAQASGVWPVVYPKGALDQSVVFGWKTDEANFVNAVCEAMETHTGREEMSQWVLSHTSWDDVATLWEQLWLRGTA